MGQTFTRQRWAETSGYTILVFDFRRVYGQSILHIFTERLTAMSHRFSISIATWYLNIQLCCVESQNGSTAAD